MDVNRTVLNGADYDACGNSSETSPLFSETTGFVRLINVINGLICLTGLTGNVLVFYVVCRFASMRTVTNVFILALALADIAFLVNIPFLITTALLENWPFGNLYCKIYYVMTTVNQFASSFFLVAMSADRYFAICLPYLSRDIRTPRTAFLICSLVWLLAILLMCPVFMYSGTVSSPDGTETHCNIFWPDVYHVEGSQAFALYCFVLGYAFPVFFILVFYGLVIRKLRRRQQHNKQSNPLSRISLRQRSKMQRVSAMILVLIFAFLTCWTPYWAYQIHITFGMGSGYMPEHHDPCRSKLDDLHNDKSWIIYTALSLQCLCYANSAVNPVLYAVLSKNFKQSYVKAWKCHVTLPRINRRALYVETRRRTVRVPDQHEHDVKLQRNHNSRSPLKLQSDLFL